MANLENTRFEDHYTLTHSDYEGPSLLCEPLEDLDAWDLYTDEQLDFLDAEFARQMADPNA